MPTIFENFLCKPSHLLITYAWHVCLQPSSFVRPQVPLDIAGFYVFWHGSCTFSQSHSHPLSQQFPFHGVTTKIHLSCLLPSSQTGACVPLPKSGAFRTYHPRPQLSSSFASSVLPSLQHLSSLSSLRPLVPSCWAAIFPSLILSRVSPYTNCTFTFASTFTSPRKMPSTHLGSVVPSTFAGQKAVPVMFVE